MTVPVPSPDVNNAACIYCGRGAGTDYAMLVIPVGSEYLAQHRCRNAYFVGGRVFDMVPVCGNCEHHHLDEIEVARTEYEQWIRKVATMQREPLVKFYKGENNGEFATATSVSDPSDFLVGCAMEIEAVITDRFGDLEFTFQVLLPQICEVWAKLKGYKADGVFEKRYLIAGEPNPEAHMRCVNVAKEVKA